MKKIYLILFCLCLSLLEMYAAKTLYFAYPNNIAPISNQSEIATVFFDNAAPFKIKIHNIFVDGIGVKENRRSTNLNVKTSVDGDIVLDLLPGEHTISFIVFGLTTEYDNILNKTTAYTTESLININILVEAGHFYAVEHEYNTGLINYGYVMSYYKNCDDIKSDVKEKIASIRNAAIANKSWKYGTNKLSTMRGIDEINNSNPEYLFFAEANIYVMRNDMPNKYSWKQIQTFCNNGWRLPTIKELTLMCENKSTIGGMEEDQYWTQHQTEYSSAVAVTTNDCKHGGRDMIDLISVRLVKVKDVITVNYNHKNLIPCNLVVMDRDLPEKYNWWNMQNACPNGWRIPTEDELKCICEHKSEIPNFDKKEYWSSSKVILTTWVDGMYRYTVKKDYKDLGWGKENIEEAIAITSNDCKSEAENKGKEYNVRLVRGIGSIAPQKSENIQAQQTQNAASQNENDKILKKDGSEIFVKVVEVGIREIIYIQNGNKYTLPKSEVFKITYSNGSKDVFSE